MSLLALLLKMQLKSKTTPFVIFIFHVLQQVIKDGVTWFYGIVRSGNVVLNQKCLFGKHRYWGFTGMCFYWLHIASWRVVEYIINNSIYLAIILRTKIRPFSKLCNVWCLNAPMKSVRIRVSSHEHHGVLKHRQLDCLFTNLCWLTYKNKKSTILAIWAHWWLVFSSLKGPVMRKGFPCPDVILSIMACPLTHWGRGKMAANFLTTFSNAFSWMRIYELRLIFHWALFLRVQLIILQHWFR